jgi:hypothetical protein
MGEEKVSIVRYVLESPMLRVEADMRERRGQNFGGRLGQPDWAGLRGVGLCRS